MTKNPNKKAGNWGALKNKPQNLVPFQVGGTTKQTYMKKQMTKKYQNGGNTAADKVAQQRAINAKRKEEALARTEKSKTDARAKIDQAQKNKPVTKPAEPVAQTTAPIRNNPENDYLVKNAGKDNTKAQVGVRTQAYNYENKGITKNKINLLGRGVTKTKTDKYLVPGKDVRFSDTDSPEIIRKKLGYLSDKSDQQKTGTQKTRSVTNLKKGTIKDVTRSTGSYVKDGEKKRVVTKSMIPGKSNSGAMKTGGSVKKYQAGGVISQAKGIAKRIANNPNKSQNRANLEAMQTARLNDYPGGINYLNRKGSNQLPVKEAIRLAAKKGEQNKKFTRNAAPSDVLEKPKYLKKAGGSIKKKK